MMIEKIARALAGDDWDGLFEHDKDDWRDKARAALTAMLDATPGMVQMAVDETGPVGCCRANEADIKEIWVRMIQDALDGEQP